MFETSYKIELLEKAIESSEKFEAKKSEVLARQNMSGLLARIKDKDIEIYQPTDINKSFKSVMRGFAGIKNTKSDATNTFYQHVITPVSMVFNIYNSTLEPASFRISSDSSSIDALAFYSAVAEAGRPQDGSWSVQAYQSMLNNLKSAVKNKEWKIKHNLIYYVVESRSHNEATVWTRDENVDSVTICEDHTVGFIKYLSELTSKLKIANTGAKFTTALHL